MSHLNICFHLAPVSLARCNANRMCAGSIPAATRNVVLRARKSVLYGCCLISLVMLKWDTG